jgi:DNA-binding IclR family transcriptional regulator
MDATIEPAAGSGRNQVHAPGLPRAQSLTRAAALVRAVGEAATGGGGATTAALARTCGLPVATAARLLATLSDEGFVERTPDGAAWTLGLPLVRLARAADRDARCSRSSPRSRARAPRSRWRGPAP